MTYKARASRVEALEKECKRLREWKQAIDSELVVSLQCTADSYDSPRRALNDLIEWNVQAATDPRCNGGYELVRHESPEDV